MKASAELGLKVMKILFLILILAIGGFSQVQQCTSTGQALWTVTPYLSEIYGCAGGGKTKVSLLLQGFVGVAQLNANRIELNYTDLIFNGMQVIAGPPDSAAPGYRTLMITNDALTVDSVNKHPPD